MMYGLRLDARQPAAQAGDARPDEHRRQPERHPRVEAVLEEIERQRSGRDEEHPDPDRPVRQPVADLVPFPDAPIVCQLDSLGVTVLTLVGRWK